jgi:hypothetical protein
MEFTPAALAYNLTRLFVRRRALESRRTGETGEIEKAEQGACRRQTSSQAHTSSAAPPKTRVVQHARSRALPKSVRIESSSSQQVLDRGSLGFLEFKLAILYPAV